MQEKKDYIYVAESTDFISTDFISGSCSTADTLYLFTYNEENKDNRAFTIDLATRESKPLRMPLEKNAASSINGMAITPDGNLAFVGRYAGDDRNDRNEQNDFVYIKTCLITGGEALSVLDITNQVTGNGAGYIQGFTIDKDHNYYLFLDKAIQVLDPQG